MKLPGIHRRTAKGRVYYYHRASGIRLPDPDDPGFLAAYEAAAQGKQPERRERTPGTVAALCELYRRSDEWREELKASTQIVRARIMAKIEEERGAAPVRGMLPKHIYADLKGLPPAAANNRLKVWRAMMKVALKENWITTNPTIGVEKRKEAREAREPWGADDLARYRDRWAIGTPERLAGELFYWTGARCIDARVLGRQMVDKKGWLCYVQEKTGGKVEIPLFASLPGWCASFEADRQMLVACLERHDDMTFITTSFGAPRSQKGISQWMSRNAREAGLALTAHGLRASRAIELYLIDATPQKIGAWTGHMSLQEVEHYTRAASRRKLLGG